ncbi:hypothetical protein ACT691_01875 [Vibrio metschnikovii]
MENQQQKDQWPFMTALIRGQVSSSNQTNDSYQGQFCGASYLGDGWLIDRCPLCGENQL